VLARAARLSSIQDFSVARLTPSGKLLASRYRPVQQYEEDRCDGLVAADSASCVRRRLSQCQGAAFSVSVVSSRRVKVEALLGPVGEL
jgi:hypothetical protein